VVDDERLTAAPTFPGARPPDRQRTVDSFGLQLAVHEWGHEDAPPLLLAHGGFDFARTFDVFAPLLAAAGWRVVSWDHRGHGDSEHAVLYNWDADVRDALAVLDTTTRRPVPFVGHSKGGSVVMQLADAMPHRCSHLVNLDGLPSRRNWPDVADHERAQLLTSEVTSWLDHRAGAATKARRPGTLEELAQRRRKMNPRLPLGWLRYLVTVGARHDDDGWRWKLDPGLRFGGFGPWRPEWSMMRMPGLAMPVLGVLGMEGEAMGWGTRPEDVLAWSPPGARVVPLDGVGHFVHIEEPDLVSSLVLDFLGDPPPAPAGWWGEGARTAPIQPARWPAGDTASGTAAATTYLTHHHASLALHRLSTGSDETARPLLLLHGLGERTPASVPSLAAGWPGPVFGLDFTGHGASTIPVGGGYSAEILLADADAAVRHLSSCTVVGRGLGAYVALLLAAARADVVHGTVLLDGPGMIASDNGPGSSSPLTIDPHAPAPPDPFALLELSRDIRTADYAAVLARMALHGSALDHPLVVATVNRPGWLAAVVDEPGVVQTDAVDALAGFAEL
jgi:pimeloyl-ACP methyl ester carboxylesterase